MMIRLSLTSSSHKTVIGSAGMLGVFIKNVSITKYFLICIYAINKTT